MNLNQILDDQTQEQNERPTYAAAHEKAERYFKLTFDHDPIAVRIGLMFFEDYPELLVPEKLDETLEYIRKATEEERSGSWREIDDYPSICYDYCFSKFNKLVERIKETYDETQLTDERIYEIKQSAFVLLYNNPTINAVFDDWGLTYSSGLCYGDPKEVELNEKLDQELACFIDKLSD